MLQLTSFLADPLGVLEPDEVHFSSSQLLPDEYGNLVDSITGEAVVCFLLIVAADLTFKQQLNRLVEHL